MGQCMPPVVHMGQKSAEVLVLMKGGWMAVARYDHHFDLWEPGDGVVASGAKLIGEVVGWLPAPERMAA